MTTKTKVLSILFVLFGVFFTSCKDEDIVPIPAKQLVAIAGADRAIEKGHPLTLDGSATERANEKPFSIQWSIVTKPQGSNAFVAAPQSIRTTITPDVVGEYVVRLTITRADQTAFDELTIRVTETEPEGPQTVIINEDITIDTILEDIFDDGASIDYMVTESIAVRANLTIRPGVVIAVSEEKGIEIVSGFISAKGTPDKPITFKGTDNRSSYWKGILIHTNNALNEFEYATISGGGSSAFIASGVQANLAVAGSGYSGGAVKVTHTSLLQSGGYGFYLQGMSTLHDFNFNQFSGNAFTAFIAANQLHKIGAGNFTGSGASQIETSGPVTGESPVTWHQIADASYLVTSDITIATGVTVEAGTSFKMTSGATIHVVDNGFLKAIGTASARISFTSINVSTYWSGLYFNSYNENNRLIYCDISYAGLNKIAGSEHAGNVSFGHAGIANIEHSVIKNGLAYGVVLKTSNQVNQNITQVNTFVDLQKGPVYPELQHEPELPPVTGVWVDGWSFQQNFNDIQDNFYNKESSIWFGGAPNPWSTGSAKGMGIRFHEDGSFTWLIAEHSPSTGCESYSAEYITGSTTIEADVLTFNQDYWRSKFVNSCDPSQNVDLDITPSPIQLPYEIEKMYDVFTGEGYWVLTFTNPDGSRFSFYRR